MAIGLGVSDLLARHRGQIKGTIKVVFQPGEEGLNGAEVMVNEGVLEAPRPDVFLSLHVWNDLPVGQVAISAGPVMAAAERWTCTIQGQGGHGALPHQTVDPIVAAAQVVSALQSVVSRNVDPQETAVVTVGTIHGGDAFNVIPPQVELSGTIRTYNPSVREMVLSRVREIVEGVAAACGTSAELTITRLTPAVINDEAVTAVMRDAAEQVDDVERVVEGVRTMGSEDAAFFMEAIPGCYVFLGSANAARGLDAPHHNPRFDLDEAVLPLGVKIMLRAVAHYV
jgi:amidohydrolase